MLPALYQTNVRSKGIERILNLYTNYSPITDSGEYSFLFENLPDEPAKMIPIIGGLLMLLGFNKSKTTFRKRTA